jgi:hypothetical protein
MISTKITAFFGEPYLEIKFMSDNSYSKKYTIQDINNQLKSAKQSVDNFFDMNGYIEDASKIRLSIIHEDDGSCELFVNVVDDTTVAVSCRSDTHIAIGTNLSVKTIKTNK